MDKLVHMHAIYTIYNYTKEMVKLSLIMLLSLRLHIAVRSLWGGAHTIIGLGYKPFILHTIQLGEQVQRSSILAD